MANLPHISLKEHYQFITIRTQDSLTPNFLSIYHKDSSKEQLLKDKCADNSSDGAYFYGRALSWLFDFLLSLRGVFYELVCFCIMPNHLHILCKQTTQLDKLVKHLKGSSARALNTILDKKGTFWEKGYYDKLIRDERHFALVYEYIKNNPQKAGFDIEGRFWSVYENSENIERVNSSAIKIAPPNLKNISGGANSFAQNTQNANSFTQNNDTLGGANSFAQNTQNANSFARDKKDKQ